MSISIDVGCRRYRHRKGCMQMLLSFSGGSDNAEQYQTGILPHSSSTSCNGHPQMLVSHRVDIEKYCLHSLMLKYLGQLGAYISPRLLMPQYIEHKPSRFVKS
jgi:hypothetical protein